MIKTLKQIKVTFTSVSLLILLCISLALVAAQMAFAQTDATSTEIGTSSVATPRDADLTAARAALGERIQEFTAKQEATATRREEMQTTIEERTAAKAAKLEERARQRITTTANRATNDLLAAIAKFETISDQLRARADGLNAKAIDTNAPVISLDTANSITAHARTMLADMDIAVQFVVTSDTPLTDWQEVKAEYLAIRDLLAEARGLLGEAIRELKDARGDEAGLGIDTSADASASNEATTTATSAEAAL